MNPKKNHSKNSWVWVIIIVLVILNFYNNSPFSISKNDYTKNIIDAVLNEIDKNYVDSLDMDSLLEISIRQILTNLDPHSVYMSSEEVSSSMEMMRGSFEGIGVEFAIHQDTIIIINVISNGPSEKKGLRAGERIIFIEDEMVAGTGITNQDVIQKLRGTRGTKVTIGVQSRIDTLIRFVEIKRDEIPLSSLDVAYEIAPGIGYIKLNRFSATTFKEFKNELIQLKELYNIESLILDLRGNSGGYLDQAIEILNEFFSDKKLLVYTKGNARKEKKYFSNHFGSFKSGKVHVLIDEGSASASEILAGAIQDHGRGVILGVRSFGKGLVQEQIALDNGALMRLTVSRYYTPSGRCIQKPYTDNQNDYFNEMYMRTDNHSIDTLTQFKTLDGRVVYGGGGITPDHIIKSKNDSVTNTLIHLYISDFFSDLAFNYVDANRNRLASVKLKDFNLSQREKRTILTEIETWIVKEFEPDYNAEQLISEIHQHESHIMNRLAALIIRQYWGWSEMQIFLNQNDKVITSSLSLLND
tara:strand:- start:324 stop:1904 length:1581 start_codon:yes stop_codon:yes gene_type:complete